MQAATLFPAIVQPDASERRLNASESQARANFTRRKRHACTGGETVASAVI
jgi:hypothetical protein